MSIDQPDGGRLLELARGLLKESILPRLPAEKTLDLLMVMRALEIAGRALDESTDSLDQRERARVEQLLGPGADAASLSAAIRSGRWDDEADAGRLYAALREDTRDRLGRVNPRYLATLDREERDRGQADHRSR
jgi:hypothetical protein